MTRPIKPKVKNFKGNVIIFITGLIKKFKSPKTTEAKINVFQKLSCIQTSDKSQVAKNKAIPDAIMHPIRLLVLIIISVTDF